MASVNFQLRSSNINAPFTARFQYSNSLKITDSNPFGLDFIESKTEIYVFTKTEIEINPQVNGKKFWTKYKKYKGNDAEILRRKNRILIEQDELKKFIIDKHLDIEKQNVIPNKIWLQSVIREYYNSKLRKEYDLEIQNIPHSIVWHFDEYTKVKESQTAERTKKKLINVRNIVMDFQEFQSNKKGFDIIYNVGDVNPNFQFELESFLRKEKLYSHNTVAKIIKVIKTICNYATTMGVQLHRQYKLVGLPYIEKDVVYLSFKELQLIKCSEKIPNELENARKWLYISCFLGQRIGDFMEFTKDMIRQENDSYTIDFIQEKTEKKISLLLHPEVVNVLKENDFNFPDKIDEVKYNDQIKLVCNLVGLNEKIKGSLLTEVKEGVWRKVTGYYEKYKLVASHIGRKSFCTNFYGKIPTSLILEVSGHSEERVLLSYINKTDETKNHLIKQYYDDINVFDN